MIKCVNEPHLDSVCVCHQEPHPMRLTQEEVEKRKAQQDSCPLNMFEHLSDLKSFFVEVYYLYLLLINFTKLIIVHLNKVPSPRVSGYQRQCSAG